MVSDLNRWLNGTMSSSSGTSVTWWDSQVVSDLLHGLVSEIDRKIVRWYDEEIPWRETGPPNHHDDKVDSDQ